MNDNELDLLLNSWQTPLPSPSLRSELRSRIPASRHRRPLLLVVAVTIVLAGTAAIGAAVWGRTSSTLSGGVSIQTTLQVEPARGQARRDLGMCYSTGGNSQKGIVYDQTAHTYVGYSLTIEPLASGQYRMTAAPLSAAAGTELTRFCERTKDYRELSLPSIPAPTVVREGEPFDIEAFSNPATGERMYWRVELSSARSHSRWVFHDFVAKSR